MDLSSGSAPDHLFNARDRLLLALSEHEVVDLLGMKQKNLRLEKPDRRVLERIVEDLKRPVSGPGKPAFDKVGHPVDCHRLFAFRLESDVSVEEDAPDTVIDLTGVFDDQEQPSGDLTFAEAGNTNRDLVSTAVDNSTDELTLSYGDNASGSATITVSATDGAGQSVTDEFDVTVTAVPDLAITDGSAGGLDFSGSVQPGTDNNPVGKAELSVFQATASFSGITIANSNPGIEGLTVARLFVSSDNTFEPIDPQLGSDVTVDPSGAASETNNAGFDVQRRVAQTAGVGSPDAETDRTTGMTSGPRNGSPEKDWQTVSYSEARTVARSAVGQVQLLGTYPNPARGRATVWFAVPEGAPSDPGSSPGQRVTLRLYDVLWRQVRRRHQGRAARAVAAHRPPAEWHVLPAAHGRGYDPDAAGGGATGTSIRASV